MCSIASLLSFFANELKSVDKGENHFLSRHVDAFQYSEGSLTGKVNASMEDKSYKVTVSQHVYDSEVGYDQYLNCRLSVPPSRFRRPPSRFERWFVGRKSYCFWPEKLLKFLISARKSLRISAKTFFLFF